MEEHIRKTERKEVQSFVGEIIKYIGVFFLQSVLIPLELGSGYLGFKE